MQPPGLHGLLETVTRLQSEFDQVAATVRVGREQAKACAVAITKHLETQQACAIEAATAKPARVETEVSAPAPGDLASPPIRANQLYPDPLAAQLLHVHPRTLKRWDKSKQVRFAAPIRVRGRIYRRGGELIEFMRNGAVAHVSPDRAVRDES
jgi:hypothetical protein